MRPTSFLRFILPALFLAGVGAQRISGQILVEEDKRPVKVTLENDKVKITEVTYQPGVPRERYTRPTSQVIVFLEACKYQRTDSKTGEKTVRDRKAGEVIWHDQGDDAPVLINLGSKPYRTLVIELKPAK